MINPVSETRDAIANLTVTISPESRGSSRTYDGIRKITTRPTANPIGTNRNQNNRLARPAAENPSKTPPQSRQKTVEHKDNSVASASSVENVRHSPRSLYIQMHSYSLKTLRQFFSLFFDKTIQFIQQIAVMFSNSIDDAGQNWLCICARMISMIQQSTDDILCNDLTELL